MNNQDPILQPLDFDALDKETFDQELQKAFDDAAKGNTFSVEEIRAEFEEE